MGIISYTGKHPLEGIVAELTAERDAALARAEAAENELHNVRVIMLKDFDRAEAAEKRVAELEARLEKERWRPLKELVENRDKFIDVRFTTNIDEYTGRPDIYDMDWAYPPDDMQWRPLNPSNSTALADSRKE